MIDAASLVAQVPHWHQDFELVPGLWTGGSYRPHGWLEWMELPADMSGLRVLEVGSCDGFFSREVAARKADLVAIDYKTRRETGFWVTEAVSGMKVEFHRMNLFDLEHARLGSFDLILCLGVLYHLPDPYRGLALLSRHCKPGGRLVVETVAAATPELDIPFMRFYKGRSLVGDLTNFWTQNPLCLEHMMGDVGLDVTRSKVLPAEGREWTRMIMEGQKVANPEAEQRLAMAYGLHDPNAAT